MIYSIKGIIEEKTPDEIIIEAGGISYSVSVPATTSAAMPAVGETAKLYTFLNVKEDALELYGFADTSAQRCFKMLIGVSGIGPKVALGILSYLSPDSVILAISAGDHKAFSKCPGIGPKLAQRLVLELKDKAGKLTSKSISAESLSLPVMPEGNARQAVQALIALGYTQQEASSAVARQEQSLPVQEIIRLALKSMAAGR